MAKVIIGVGPQSNHLTALLVQNILARNDVDELAAVGVYDDGKGDGKGDRKAIRRAVNSWRRWRPWRKPIADISVSPSGEPRAGDVAQQIVNQFKRKALHHNPNFALLIIDADLLVKHADIFTYMREIAGPNLAMSAICIARGEEDERDVAPVLQHLTTRVDPHKDDIAGGPILSSVVMVRADSPLALASYGYKLMATSLAAMWSRPRRGQLPTPFKSLDDHLGAMRQRGHRICGLAAASKGVPEAPGAFSRLLYRVTPFRVKDQQVKDCALTVARSLLSNNPLPMTSTLDGFDLERVHDMDSTLSIMVPLRPWRLDYADILGGVEGKLNGMHEPARRATSGQPRAGDQEQRYMLRLTSITRRPGVDLTKMDAFADQQKVRAERQGYSSAGDGGDQQIQTWKGPFYCQISVFYPVTLSSESSEATASQR